MDFVPIPSKYQSASEDGVLSPKLHEIKTARNTPTSHRIVGITAPTKDDWSNDFELAKDAGKLLKKKDLGIVSAATAQQYCRTKRIASARLQRGTLELLSSSFVNKPIDRGLETDSDGSTSAQASARHVLAKVSSAPFRTRENFSEDCELNVSSKGQFAAHFKEVGRHQEKNSGVPGLKLSFNCSVSGRSTEITDNGGFLVDKRSRNGKEVELEENKNLLDLPSRNSPIKANTKHIWNDDSDSLSSVSDWDAEFENESRPLGSKETDYTQKIASKLHKPEFQEHLAGLRGLISGHGVQDDSGEAIEEDHIPRSRCLIRQAIEGNLAPTMVRYPKPSALYSLRTQNGMRFMQETTLEEWLCTLVSSKKNLVDDIRNKKSKVDAKSDDFSSTYKDLIISARRSPSGSLRWASYYLSIVWKNYVAHRDNIAAQIALQVLYTVFRISGMTKKRDQSEEFSWQDENLDNSSIEKEAKINSVALAMRFMAFFFVASSTKPQSHACLPLYGKQRCQISAISKEYFDDSFVLNNHLSVEHIEKWAKFLVLIVRCLNLGLLAFVRRASLICRSLKYHSVLEVAETDDDWAINPQCFVAMMCGVGSWVEEHVPGRLKPFVEARLALIEAQAAAHALATCSLEPSDLNSPILLGPHHFRSTMERELPAKHFGFDGQACASQSDSRTSSCWNFFYGPPVSSAASCLSPESQLVESVLSQFCHVYISASQKIGNVNLKEDEIWEIRDNLGAFSEADPIQVQAECLCDIQLLLNSMSPISTVKSDHLQDGLDRLQLDLESWISSDSRIEEEVIDIVRKSRMEQILSSKDDTPEIDEDDLPISMCIGVAHFNETYSTSYATLCGSDPQYRIDLLFLLYPKIPTNTFLKAKAAFVLALHVLNESKDANLAEELAFECIFILDNIRFDLKECEHASMLSHLATNAMVLYGKCLEGNAKYKYAIGAYESAIESYKVREGKDFHLLFRSLCSTCVKNHDWERALKYHLAILEVAKEDENLNEFVYISERVAMMLLEQHADFDKSESYIRLALAYLEGRSEDGSLQLTSVSGYRDCESGSEAVSSVGLTNTSEGRNSIALSSAAAFRHSMWLKLQQTLARIFMAANRMEDAAKLLSEIVSTSKLPHSNSFFRTISSKTLGYLTYPASDSCRSAVSTCFPGLNQSENFPCAGNLEIYLLLAEACLKLRWLADCTCALDSAAQAASCGQWCNPMYAVLSTNPGKEPQERPHRPRPTGSMIRDLLVCLQSCYGIELCRKYTLLRVRCALHQGLPKESLSWVDTLIQITERVPHSRFSNLAPSEERECFSSSNGKENDGTPFDDAEIDSPNMSESPRLTVVQLGQLFYMRGKILQMQYYPTILGPLSSQRRLQVNQCPYKLCRGCGSTTDIKCAASTPFQRDLFRGHMERQVSCEASECEEGYRQCLNAFLCADEYFSSIDDTLWQSKTCSRIAEVKLSELIRVSESNHHQKLEESKIAATLDEIEAFANDAIDFCASIGYAPLMIRCLINMAELHKLRHEIPKAQACLQEASLLINTLFLTKVVPVSSSALAMRSDSSHCHHSFGYSDQTSKASKKGSKQNLRKGTEFDSSSDDTMHYARISRVENLPSTNLRILTYVTRMLRVAFDHQPNETGMGRMKKYLVNQRTDMRFSWDYLNSLCWENYSFCTKFQLPEHQSTTLYDEYLSDASIDLTLQHSSLNIQGLVRHPLQNSNGSSMSVTETSSWEKKMSKTLNVQSKPTCFTDQTHRRNFSDTSPKLFPTFSRQSPAPRLKESVLTSSSRFQRSQCTSCNLLGTRSAIPSDHERMSSAFWRCFYRLKLLAHGANGESLHMEEVHSQSLDLLREILRLANAGQSSCEVTDTAFYDLSEVVSSSVSETCSTKKRDENDMIAPGLYIFGWKGSLVTVEQHASFYHKVESSCVLKKSPPLRIFCRRLEESNPMRSITLEDVIFRVNPAESSRNLCALSEFLGCFKVDDLFNFISLLLLERPIVIAAKQASTRSQTIDSLLALISPLKWQHPLAPSVPSTLSYTCGRLLHKSQYIVGLHPSAVADFVQGLGDGNSERCLDGQSCIYPTIINLDSLGVTFASERIPMIPLPFQCLLHRCLDQRSLSNPLSRSEENHRRSSPLRVGLSKSCVPNTDEASAPFHGKPNRSSVSLIKCRILYSGMSKILVWFLRFLPHFYDSSNDTFDVAGFCFALRIEDPTGTFFAWLAASDMFKAYLRKSGPQEAMSSSNAINFHLRHKATLYRSIVGISRNCLAIVGIIEFSMDRDFIFSDRNAKHSLPQWSQESSRSPKYGMKSMARFGHETILKNRMGGEFANCVIFYLQKTQLDAVKEESKKGNSCEGQNLNEQSVNGKSILKPTMTSKASGPLKLSKLLLQDRAKSQLSNLKLKKRWVSLDKSTVQYFHHRKQNNPKGCVNLDDPTTRVLLPAYTLDTDDSRDQNLADIVLERTQKIPGDLLIDDVPLSKNDDHWLYLVQQLNAEKRVRVLKLRFSDELEEQIWANAIRVNFMQPQLLFKLFEE